ncbi:MAG: hypothetical protein NW226_19590 [Microscillaceae bacterium]|nr:hypothetical protein [Microscillaceae bacterium]
MKIVNKLHLLVFFVLLGSLCSCNHTTSTKTPKKNIYFNLAELVLTQVHLLDSLKPQVRKYIRSENSEENKVIQPEKWSRELYLFREADINKSAYYGLYVLNKLNDSGMQIEDYEAQTDELHTRKLTVSRKPGKTQPSTISIVVKRENVLYHTQRDLTLVFSDEPRPRLKSYVIRAKQSSVFSKKNDFEIKGEIVYP